MRRSALTILVASIGLMSVAETASGFSCFPAPPLSQLADAYQIVLLAEWTGAEKPTEEQQPGRTHLKVIACRPADGLRLKAGAAVSLPTYHEGRPGDLLLVIGGNPIGGAPQVEVGTIDAEAVVPGSRTLFRYLCELPPWGPDRYRHYLKHLEHADEAVVEDAHQSLQGYKELAAVRKDFPRERLRAWLTDPDTPVERRGLYGLMLGLCGDESDAKLLGQIALQPSQDFRPRIEDVMFGYLLLTGEDGLRRLEKAKFALDSGAPFSETYAAMLAVKSMWHHGGDRIPRERLKESMRLLLDRPAIADLVIMDLARWKDWEVQERITRLYGATNYANKPHLKRAIARYLIAAANDPARDPDGNHDRHVVEARRQIERLRQTDPEIVKMAERLAARYPIR